MAPSDPLQRPGLVGVDVRAGRAHDRVDRSEHRHQAEHVAAGAGEREQRLDVAPNSSANRPWHSRVHAIVAVGEGVTLVGGDDRGDDGRMGAGGVVAGERALRWRGKLHATVSASPGALSASDGRRADIAEVDSRVTDGGKLTAAERRVAQAVLERPQLVAFGTVADLAAQAGAGAATVVRLAAKLGFDGFTALQSSVQDDLARQLRPAVERIRELADRRTRRAAPGRSPSPTSPRRSTSVSRDDLRRGGRAAQRSRSGPSSCSPARPSTAWRSSSSTTSARCATASSTVAGNDVAVRRQLALSRAALDARRHRPAPLRTLAARRRDVRQRRRPHDRRLDRRPAVAAGDDRHDYSFTLAARSARRSTATSGRWRCSS